MRKRGGVGMLLKKNLARNVFGPMSNCARPKGEYKQDLKSLLSVPACMAYELRMLTPCLQTSL